MAEKHKWNITVEKKGNPIVFRNPSGGSVLDHISFEGSISEVLMKIKTYMDNEREKQDKLECDMGEPT